MANPMRFSLTLRLTKNGMTLFSTTPQTEIYSIHANFCPTIQLPDLKTHLSYFERMRNLVAVLAANEVSIFAMEVHLVVDHPRFEIWKSALH